MSNKGCTGVDVLRQVKGLALVISDRADEVYGVEVAPSLEVGMLRRIIHIDLAALQDLERATTIDLSDDEGASPRLTLVAYHAADTYGAVKLGLYPGR